MFEARSADPPQPVEAVPVVSDPGPRAEWRIVVIILTVAVVTGWAVRAIPSVKVPELGATPNPPVDRAFSIDTNRAKFAGANSEPAPGTRLRSTL